ncbi:hypothetical protein BD414DRAFT_490800 [Trametes punicea]|nr:hypothetical protein BD414DRAFT_490800 [Trametes punicea]
MVVVLVVTRRACAVYAMGDTVSPLVSARPLPWPCLCAVRLITFFAPPCVQTPSFACSPDPALPWRACVRRTARLDAGSHDVSENTPNVH